MPEEAEGHRKGEVARKKEEVPRLEKAQRFLRMPSNVRHMLESIKAGRFWLSARTGFQYYMCKHGNYSMITMMYWVMLTSVGGGTHGTRVQYRLLPVYK